MHAVVDCGLKTIYCLIPVSEMFACSGLRYNNIAKNNKKNYWFIKLYTALTSFKSKNAFS